MTQKKQKKKYRPKRTPPLEINVQQLDQIVDKACKDPLSQEEGDLLKTSIHAMAERLRRQFQSRTTEKAKDVAGGVNEESGSSASSGEVTESPQPAEEKKARPGHGRNGAADYSGAKVVLVPLQTLSPKCICPGCCRGKVYPVPPSVRIRIVGMPPIQATVYNGEMVRCNLCGETFEAEFPPDVGEEKYDASVASMVAQLRYGSGMPFYRIEKFEAQMGIPLPASTQFELVDAAADKLRPVQEHLIHQAAQGEVLYHDDTRVRILDEVPVPEGQDEDRTGLHTTGVVSRVENHLIGLFTSGPQHAGENMGDLLEQRQKDLPAPLLMNDGLSHNTSKLPPELEVVLANCLTHGRRQFVNVLEAFPSDCQHVIEQLRLVYKHDAQARDAGMDPQARLAWHQEKSGPVMEELKTWMEFQLDERNEKRIEDNSGLGKAVRYMLKRWARLTRFLQIPGAPLDNNAAERSLKKAVLARKNSLFYKTLHGAQVGDLFMSLIHTCELNKVNPFRYLTDLQRHAEEVRDNPGAWLPWNFHLQLSPSPG